jgi:hypothetical protein
MAPNTFGLVGAPHRLEGRLAGGLPVALRRDASVVDQHVQAPELALQVRARLLDRERIGDVERDRAGVDAFGAQCGGSSFPAPRIASADQHGHPLASETTRRLRVRSPFSRR